MWFFVGARGGSPLARYYSLHTHTQLFCKKRVVSPLKIHLYKKKKYADPLALLV